LHSTVQEVTTSCIGSQDRDTCRSGQADINQTGSYVFQNILDATGSTREEFAHWLKNR